MYTIGAIDNELRIYDIGTTDFSSNGLGILENATDLQITRTINEMWTLSMTYPIVDSKYAFISPMKLLKINGQIYEINVVSRETTSTDILKVSAKHILYTADRVYIPLLTEAIVDVDARQIMEMAFTGTDFNVMTESEVEALGMEWVNQRTDYLDTSPSNPLKVVNKIRELVGRGELYIDNLNIALVERIGTDKNERLSLEAGNITNLQYAVSSDNIITHLNPYGANWLPITSVNNGSETIISPNANKYPKNEAYISFSEETQPERLKARALALFDNRNANRIDEPIRTASCDWINISLADNYTGVPIEQLELGDSVVIEDIEDDDFTEQRIISITEYPDEPSKNKITIGRPQIDFIIDIIGDLADLDGSILAAIQNYKFDIPSSTIIEVVEEKVLAAEVIEAGTAFNENTFTEYLETALKDFLCTPNIKIEEGQHKWVDEVPTYNASASATGNNARHYMRARDIRMEFLEAPLYAHADLTRIPSAGVEDFKIDGKQVYWTSITGGETEGQQPYKFRTFTSPHENPNIMAESYEFFKVKIRKHLSYNGKLIIGWFSTTEGYLAPRILFGTGRARENGTTIPVAGYNAGQGVVHKDADSLDVCMVSEKFNGLQGLSITEEHINRKLGNREVLQPVIFVQQTDPKNEGEVPDKSIWIKW